MDKYNHWLGKFLKWINGAAGGYAITLGQTTYYSEKMYIVKLNKQWSNHEEWHKIQYKKEGTFLFLVKYLYYQIRYGYENNPFEIDARNHE